MATGKDINVTAVPIYIVALLPIFCPYFILNLSCMFTPMYTEPAIMHCFVKKEKYICQSVTAYLVDCGFLMSNPPPNIS